MIPALAFALLSQTSSTDQALMKLTEEYVEAVRTYDIKRMAEFFHPAYLEVSPRGIVEDKTAILKSFDLPAEKRFVATQVVLTEWKLAHPRKDLATATFKQTYVFVRNEKEMKINLRVSATWIKDRKNWVMTQQQSTVLDAPPQRPSK